MKELTVAFQVKRWGEGYACEVLGNPLTRAWGRTPLHAIYYMALRVGMLTYGEI